MSTEISNLNDAGELNLDSSEDTSKIVNEILNEMNNTSDNVVVDTPPEPLLTGGSTVEPSGMGMSNVQTVVEDVNGRDNLNTQHLSHQMDSDINMGVVNNLTPQVVPEKQHNIVMNIESTQNFLESLTYRLQDPLLYIVVSLIMFSPVVQKSLGRILPTIFNSTLGIAPWLSVLFKSLFGSLIFFGFKNIL